MARMFKSRESNIIYNIPVIMVTCKCDPIRVSKKKASASVHVP